MSELCRFHGIIIRIFNREHNPPHFHAVYGDDEALIEIETLEIYSGKLPPRQMRQVREWAEARQGELSVAWRRGQERRPMGKIDPLS